jgi:hypothetical protein
MIKSENGLELPVRAVIARRVSFYVVAPRLEQLKHGLIS